MLVDVHRNLKPVSRHPHAASIRLLRARAGATGMQLMMAELDRKVGGREVATSSWMPPRGSWQNTPFAPLAQIAGANWTVSGQLFGAVVWQYFMERPDVWGFVGANIPGHVGGITYFRV